MAEAEGIGAALDAEEGGADRSEGGSADAVGIALALDAAHHDPELGPAVRRYLNRQRTLIDLQIKHFDEEHTLAIAAARRKGFIDRMRICLQMLVAAIIGGIVIAVLMMLWDAVNDRDVVIDAFSVPEDLAHHGFTGEAVAKRILDRLAEINNTSGTVRAANSYSNSLAGDLKLEIPETGISIGELSRTLHEKLGHSIHVGGELTHSGDSVTVRIRLGDEYQVETTGPETDISTLVRDAATKIYAKTQPYRYGYWLYATDPQTAEATFRQLAIAGPRTERVWALHGLALVAGSFRDAIELDRQALEIDPNFFLSHLTRSDAYLDIGHEEDALRESQLTINGAASGADSGLSKSGRESLRAQAALNRDFALGDYQSALIDVAVILDSGESDSRRSAALLDKAQLLTEMHDIKAASEVLGLFPTPKNARSDATLSDRKSELMAARGEWDSAVTALEHVRDLTPSLQKGLEQERNVMRTGPILAEAYAHRGRDGAADTLLQQLPQDAYPVWLSRGRIATLRRDYAGAADAFAEATHQAPSIPRAYLDWGDMLAAKGDLAGAIAKYAEASRRGPRWADPLKAWGDVLTRQGLSHQALEKYRQALDRAPHWEELKTIVAAKK